MHKPGKKIIVIGAGFSSLAAASNLAHAGFDVTIVEKNNNIGGRARSFSDKGFTFDMGPTFYWMPDIFETFFERFGKKVFDYYELERLDPSYRIYFGHDDFLDMHAKEEELFKAFESIEKGSSKKLNSILNKAEKDYNLAIGELVYSPGLSPLELVGLRTAKRLGLFIKNIRQLFASSFKSSKLRKALEFPVLFLGAKPSKTPAFYYFMNYADIKLGTWYPKGGMSKVSKGIGKLAQDLGVKIKLNVEVQSINSKNGIVTSITTKQGKLLCDYLVSGADYHHTELLLDKELRNYSEQYWENKTFSPSALLFYLGFDKKISGIEHHTLFFDVDFDQHAEEIYDSPSWPKNPLFYASFPSLTEHGFAPEGMECATILIPIASGLEDSEDQRNIYLTMILERIEKITGQDIKNSLIYNNSYCLNDFKADYNSFKGNAYGLANTLKQTAFLRPAITNKKLNNLFYTGQLTVPGPGLPPAIISGTIVADQIASRELLKQAG